MPDTTLPPSVPPSVPPSLPASLPVQVPLTRTPLGLLASLTTARRNLLEIIPQAALEQPILSGRTVRRWHMVMEPGAIRQMLLEREDNYPKSVVTKSLLRPAIGESLFVAEGAHWRWQRRAASPVFTHRNIANLTPIMSTAARRATDRIAAAGPRAVNLVDEMTATTFDVIADVTFSENDAFDRGIIQRALDDYVSHAGKVSVLDLLGAPDWIPRPDRMGSGDAMKSTRAQADAAIARRAADGAGNPPDLLDLLMAGEDPKSGRRMSADELRDNLLTFIVAGHETTAMTLAWALYLVAFDGEVQARAHAELDATIGSRPATAEDLEALPFIRHIVEEALRLYPPAGIVSRTARDHDQLCGHEIRPGDTCMIPIYALHRHRALWDHPDAFLPDRWSGSRPERYSYLPFGDGPRICIGMSFALQEAVIVLATLLARFRFAPVRGRDPKPVMILTTRPEGGVWLMAQER